MAECMWVQQIPKGSDCFRGAFGANLFRGGGLWHGEKNILHWLQPYVLSSPQHFPFWSSLHMPGKTALFNKGTGKYAFMVVIDQEHYNEFKDIVESWRSVSAIATALLHDKAAVPWPASMTPTKRQSVSWSSNSWSILNRYPPNHLSWSFPLPGFPSATPHRKPVMWLMHFSKPCYGLTKNECKQEQVSHGLPALLLSLYDRIISWLT